MSRIYCIKEKKKKTEDIDPIYVRSKNNRLMLKAKCRSCGIIKTQLEELRFLCSARRLTILNICMKFQEDIFYGFHVTHRHDFVTELLLTSSKGNN